MKKLRDVAHKKLRREDNVCSTWLGKGKTHLLGERILEYLTAPQAQLITSYEKLKIEPVSSILLLLFSLCLSA
jgi:hypothetical protein